MSLVRMGTSRSSSRQAEVLRTLSVQNRCFEAPLAYPFIGNNFTFSAYHCQHFHIFTLWLPTISHFHPITANGFTVSPLFCQQFHNFPPFLPTVSHFHPFTAKNFTCFDVVPVHTSKTLTENAGFDNSFVSRNYLWQTGIQAGAYPAAHAKHFASDVMRFPKDNEKVNHKVLNMIWTADYSELLSFVSSSSFLYFIYF